MGLGRAFRAFVLVCLAIGAVITTASSVNAQTGLASLVEDFAYPDAAAIEATRGFKVLSGDGNLLIVDCPAVHPVDADLVVIETFEPGLSNVCLRMLGAVGYLALELPSVYTIETDEHEFTATLRGSDGQVKQAELDPDGPSCHWSEGSPGCHNPVSRWFPGSPGATLLEISGRPGGGGGAAPLPAGAHGSVARLTSGLPGRAGSRGCSATVVAPTWVLSAASCFGATGDVQVGVPPMSSVVSVPGQASRKVVHVVPHPDRDVVLAKLDVGLAGVSPSPIASTSPVVAGRVEVKGFGRDGTTWAPSTAHAVAAGVTGVSGSLLSLASDGPVCRGTGGGPVMDASGAVVAVVTSSGQSGCLGTVGTSPAVAASRVDDVRTWIGDEIRYGVSYLRNPQSGKCADVDISAEGTQPIFGTRVQVWTCNGQWNQKLTWHSDGTIRSPQRGECLDAVPLLSEEGSPIYTRPCSGRGYQRWVLNGDGSIRNLQSNKCLDLHITSAGASDGNRLQLWNCSGTWNQKWAFHSVDGEVRNPASDRCLDMDLAPTGNTPFGARVQLWTCTGTWNQKWVPSSDGTLRNPEIGRCLGYFLEGDGSGVFVQPCDGGVHQTWVPQADGTVRNPKTGKCLDVSSTVTTYANGTPAVLHTCHGGWQQRWTFEWVDGRSKPSYPNPFGSLDAVTGGVGTVRVQGWAIDPDTLNPIDVQVFVDGALAGAGRAAHLRSDLVTAQPPYGARHGFDVTAPAFAGDRSVCVAAMNVGSGSNTWLGCKQVGVS